MWVAIGLAVLYHEFSCADGELLSEEVDRQLVKRPLIVYGLIAVTVAHLLNRLPQQLDPFHWVYLTNHHITRGTK